MHPLLHRRHPTRCNRALLQSLVAFAYIVAATLFLPDSTEATETSYRGMPLYEIYDDKQIVNASRPHLIANAPDGSLFFVNESGLYTFDGAQWHQILATHVTRQRITAIAWANGKVYLGGYGNITLLDLNHPDGIRRETVATTTGANVSNESYTQAYPIGDKIYFLGQHLVTILDLESHTTHDIATDAWIGASFVRNGTLYIADNRKGLLKLEGKELVPLPAFATFTDVHAIALCSTDADGNLIFNTESRQLYFSAATTPLESLRKIDIDIASSITALQILDENYSAISIDNEGIVMIDHRGARHSVIDKALDYRLTSASRLHVDPNGTLWALLNRSIGKILIKNPLSAIDERMRPSLNWPQAVQTREHTLILSGGKLLQPQFDAHGRLLGFAEKELLSRNYINAAADSDGTLYIHSDNQLKSYEEGVLKILGPARHCDRIHPLSDSLIATASAKDFSIYRRVEDRIELIHTIDHAFGFINRIASAEDGAVWTEVGLGRVGRFWFDGEHLQTRLYTHKDGLPPDWVALWPHSDRIYFTENSGVYTYDPANDRFEKTDILEPYLPSKDGPTSRVATDPDGNIFASHAGSTSILWLQNDGSYRKDTQSIRHLGEEYVHQFVFLPDGDSLFLTPSEVFHLDTQLTRSAQQNSDKPDPLLLEITDPKGGVVYFRNSGNFESVPNIELSPRDRNLSFLLGSKETSNLKAPYYQFLLSGVSEEWSRRSQVNQISFYDLSPGSYALRVRVSSRGDDHFQEIAIPFSIQPTIIEESFVRIVLLLLAAAGLFFGFTYFSRNLKKSNERLEKMVEARTQEIATKNTLLQANARTLTNTLHDLQSAQDQLMNTSRKAGMAEVATNVLHNVGNVLNSINVGIVALSQRLNHDRVGKLSRVSEIITENEDRLDTFFTEDPRGKAIPAYISQLSQVMQDDFAHYQIEVDCIKENIDHVKRIINVQQAHAKVVDIRQKVELEQLIESAITMILGDPEGGLLEVTRHCDPDLQIISDKHRILQIVANFIKNAKESIAESGIGLGLIEIEARRLPDGQNIKISISDNGVGVAPDDLKKIFGHGFTTKEEGHGFGMHSCANAARLLGGSVEITSPGLGKGAVVTLFLPIEQPVDSDEDSEK